MILLYENKCVYQFMPRGQTSDKTKVRINLINQSICFKYRSLSTQRRRITFDGWPVVLPAYLIEHQHTSFRIGYRYGMVEDPVLPFCILHDLGVMTRSHELFILPDDHLMMVLHHGLALLVEIGTKEIAGASDNSGIGAVEPLAAGADGGEHIVIAVPLVDIDPFVGGAGYPAFLGTGSDREAVV